METIHPEVRRPELKKIAAAFVAGIFLTLAPGAAMAAPPGAIDSEIVIGQSVPLTGVDAQIGAEMQAGAQAYFDHVNSKGGIGGRKIVLQTYDDAGIPAKTGENTQRLIAQDQVMALFGYVGTNNVMSAMPVFTKARVPLIGALAGSEAMRTPFNKYIFNTRASYFAETEKMVDLLVTLGMTKIALLYQNDDYGSAGLAGVNRALKRHGISLVALEKVEPNSEEISGAAASISKTTPQAVILVTGYNASAAFIQRTKALGSHPRFVNVSYVGAKALSERLGSDGKGVIVSQVVPYPWGTRSALVREYQQISAQSNPRNAISFTNFEGFIAAKVLALGLSRISGTPTRANLIAALETLDQYDLGGFTIDYGPTDHSGSSFSELTMISQDGKFIH
ncbi:ABC transporter substrate-binding protein [Variovorax sp. ZS18.2.2]|uniref:ABC transporter substrate-binding protein n=1 Tax=Variovorax sp. ZS18.2.2 TaxID=2971255 RepID=UPI0021517C11|nr:ABC transporter substrate-binding protein [Variovorax sp. ZS18.2.2]MCR6476294.1 ABC transporter substrate-binding protein [Variovorax sp. ZS18.2.2]